MSQRYKGGLVSSVPPTITPASGTSAGGTASGVWSEGQVFQARGSSLWPRVSGESSYLGSGTYTWVCPAGITSVSVVCVGATNQWNGLTGRGGGGLGWKNNISVTPGNSYTVVVATSTPADVSYFIDTSTVAGYSANGQNGGSYVGDGGGAGGNGGNAGGNGAGGGGAGGYLGNGGNGGTGGANSGNAASAGSGGGGGGAGATTGGFGGGGGGVGIYGIGSDGVAGIYNAAADYVPGGGGGGSGGDTGTPSNTGGAYSSIKYGGGTAGTTASVSGGGQPAAVRIIFPANIMNFPYNAAQVT